MADFDKEAELNDEIELAKEQSQLTFWAEVARLFPEIRTGDLAPEVVFEFDEACLKAIRLWLRTNGGPRYKHL